MFDNIINKNIIFLQNHGVKIDNNDDKAIYKYGLQILYYYIIDLAVVFSLAYLFGRLYETAIMTFIFGLLQVFGGGYHARTPLRCLFIMFAGAAAGNVLITLMAGKFLINVVALIILGGGILFFQPVTNKRHPISNKVKQRSKKVVIIAVILLMAGVLMLSYLDRYIEVATMTVTIGLYFISLTTAKIRT